MLKRLRRRLNIGEVMVGVALLALVLGIGRATAETLFGHREFSIPGGIGILILALGPLMVVSYLVLFTIPQLGISVLLRLVPSLRPEEEDPL